MFYYVIEQVKTDLVSQSLCQKVVLCAVRVAEKTIKYTLLHVHCTPSTQISDQRPRYHVTLHDAGPHLFYTYTINNPSRNSAEHLALV